MDIIKGIIAGFTLGLLFYLAIKPELVLMLLNSIDKLANFKFKK